MSETKAAQELKPVVSPAFSASSVRSLFAGNDIVVVLLIFAAFASLASPIFLTEGNLKNILNQASVLGILACAQFLVVLIGGFDLSVAAIMWPCPL